MEKNDHVYIPLLYNGSVEKDNVIAISILHVEHDGGVFYTGSGVPRNFLSPGFYKKEKYPYM